MEEHKYKGALTREQFLFKEMRITAMVLSEIEDDDAAFQKIVDENLYQYPTEKTIKSIAKACMRRLRLLSDKLIDIVAYGSVYDAKQICLYAIMKDNKLVWDFMIDLIGEKYRTQDFNFSIKDMNVFFLNLQEQNEVVASWSDSTIYKIKTVLKNILIENGYLDDKKSEELNQVLLGLDLETEIKNNHDDTALIAFNYFG